MAIKLKTKVALGGSFLFALLILVGTVCFYYFNQVSNESQQIIKDNYESLNYAQQMLTELNEPDSAHPVINKLDHLIILQEGNTTEEGEKQVTSSLRNHFTGIKNGKINDSVLTLMRLDINKIIQVNLSAIEQKNKSSQESTKKGKTIISIILTICLLTGITFLYNFPGLIASPIATLTSGIKEIAGKNYSQRIVIKRNDEFGDLAHAFNTMAEKLDEYEHSNLAKILFEKQRAETVINSLKDATIGVDSKGIILFANQQALQLLGLSESAIVGQQQTVVQKKNDLFDFLIKEQNQVPFKIVVDNKENYFTRELIDITADGEKLGFVIVLRNITPFKELDTAKTHFIATISHELKTPLASSDLSLKLLEDERTGQLNTEQRELIQHIREDNKRLLKILSELLNMAQVESGKIQLTLTQIAPNDLIQKPLAETLTLADAKQIKIDQLISPELPLVVADADKTGWVIANFLTNAIRYSPINGIVQLVIEKHADGVCFSVHDTGIGIEEQFREKIFDRYFRVPGTSEGTGLGLAISKEFIEAQGGRIWMEKAEPYGSVFKFLLISVT